MSDDKVVIDEPNQKAVLTPTADEIRQMYKVIEDEVLPKTRKGVKEGNKVFGAAILSPELQCKFCETNAETDCPIFHGEVHCIYQWSKATPPAERGPMAQSSIFLSTHEPCCMCISSILWAGFPVVYYFFPYSVTSAQGIPHDIKTMHELWGVTTYRKQNAYLSTACLMDLVAALPDGADKTELVATQDRLLKAYDEMANYYHTEKANNPENSLVLG
ncbi:unnamed protein product [Cylindrotheca closterium]|uniref:CMP/dCMP-type deaminase domain-containing protein n=1 Tax=Cylindrotheca closterium TaxID=2856 RepID=A0AAD2FD97_9STRA|nr:unnamed protein product [Cylindrotheca closterium]